MALLNPIHTVGSTVMPIAPSKYEITYSDVSASDSGRTEDATMHKRKIAQKIKIGIEYSGIKTATLKTILTAFNPEYVSVKFINPKDGTANLDYYDTKTFYVGDRKSPMYNAALDIWDNVAFNIIER